MRLVLIALLVLTMAGAASATSFEVGTQATETATTGVRTALSCYGQNFTHIFTQDSLKVWGNAFDLGPVAGPLTTLTFKHHTGIATPMPGPYTYTASVWDAATCTPVGITERRTCPGGEGTPGSNEVIVDLCPYGWVASDVIIAGVQPFTYGIPPGSTAANTYPRIQMDMNYGGGGVDGCGSLVILDDGGPGVPGCYQITATGGQVVDFAVYFVFDECIAPPTGGCCDVATGACTITTELGCDFTWLGADIPCNTTTCLPVPTEPTTWGAVKALFR
jgi:hypothetical protein